MRWVWVGRVLLLISLAALGAYCSPRQSGSDTSGAGAETARQLALIDIESGSYERSISQGAQLAYGSMLDTLKLQLGREPTDREKGAVVRMLESNLSQVMDRDSWEEMLTELYGDHFSAEELSQFLDFVQTPAGRRMLAVQESFDADREKRIDDLIEARLESFTQAVDGGLARIFPELGKEEAPR